MGEDKAPQPEADQTASGDQAPSPDAERTKSFGEGRRGVDFINPEPAPVDGFRPSLDAPQATPAQASDSKESVPPSGGDAGGEGDQ